MEQFVRFFVVGFGLTYLFSRQIKSAHQSYGLINSIQSEFKMRIHLRFKVIKLKLI